MAISPARAHRAKTARRRHAHIRRVGPDMREMFDPGFSILPLSGCERQACPIALHFVNA